MTDPSEDSKPRPWTPEEIEEKGMAPWKVAGPSDSQPGYRGPQILYGHLRGFFETFVYHPDPRVYDVLTAWTLHTWHYRKFRASPPLLILGPVNSGKTTVLECLEEVAYRGVRGGSMSNPSMFRLSEWAGPSFLVDEAQVYNREEWAECRAFLSERYRQGGRVMRVEQIGEGKGFRVVYFKAYGPTALAQSESSWEGMISRAIVINMEKGRAPQKTLTKMFEEEGAKFRVWFRQYAESFEPLAPHEGEEAIDAALQALIEKGKIDAKEPDLFPIPDLSMFEDGRLVEKVEPLLACAPIGEARDNILSFARDMARKQEANENTSYLVEYLQAYLACMVESSKVSAKAIRVQVATLRACDLKDRGMPKHRWIMSCMETLGFQRTRMNDGSTGVLVDPKLEERLKKRYSLGESSESSDSSVHEEKRPTQSEDTEDTEDYRKDPDYQILKEGSLSGDYGGRVN